MTHRITSKGVQDWIPAQPRPFLRTIMASTNPTPTGGDGILTSEHFVDLLYPKSVNERSSLQRLKVKAYPFPMYLSQNAGSYVTFDFENLLPLFPGLALQTFEVHDAYHGPDVAEDGWGHNTTNTFVGDMIKKGNGWKELVFESLSDRWLESVRFTKLSHGEESEEVHERSPQPQTWDEMIKARDGEGSGAGVEMWYKKAEQGSDWVKVDGQYKSSFVEKESGNDDEELSRPAIKLHIKRGDGADYVQNDHKSLDPEAWGLQQGLYKAFEEIGWPKIKEDDLFIPGAEEDPTAHL